VTLRAPIAVTVEVRGADRRAFRLAWNIGEDGVRLERPAPFELGRPVEIRFTMPDGGDALELHAEVRPADGGDEHEGDGEGERGGRELGFLGLQEPDRAVLRQYVINRLELPAFQ
jgi:hypothetical protein